jgi:hypothetical protein
VPAAAFLDSTLPGFDEFASKTRSFTHVRLRVNFETLRQHRPYRVGPVWPADEERQNIQNFVLGKFGLDYAPDEVWDAADDPQTHEERSRQRTAYRFQRPGFDVSACDAAVVLVFAGRIDCVRDSH